MRAHPALGLVLLVASIACSDVKRRVSALWAPSDPLVGSWREVVKDNHGKVEAPGRIAFKDNGQCIMSMGIDPLVDFTRLMQDIPCHYNRGGGKLVISMDGAALEKKIAAHVKNMGKALDKGIGPVPDIVSTVHVEGDVLEMTTEKGRLETYVRLRE